MLAGKDVRALEVASLELATVADQVESKELRWLELAELAGDI